MVPLDLLLQAPQVKSYDKSLELPPLLLGLTLL